MKEKMKGMLAGFIFRCIAFFTLGQISPILSGCVIVEREGRVLLVHRSDGLGYTIPGGIVRYKETMEQCLLREVSEETGYQIQLTGFVGVYSSLHRDPRFRAVALAYTGTILDGEEHGSGEGEPCWKEPGEVFGQMAFDCEHMLKDYLSGKTRFS